ncbi:helix-turn-helix transcriptional regulator [Ectothiorhodospiraceae bacterium WFHF3C12]|nr:helix-turn-helix transcriptional regulator [Ectothiorhodospiraceae bacterium WFHF3C12]
MEMNSAVARLAALAQPLRLSVFRYLVEAGPGGASVGEIREAVAAAPATLSFHLKELQAAGLVDTCREGRRIRCRARYQAMNELIGYLTENCCRGEGAAAPGGECAITEGEAS